MRWRLSLLAGAVALSQAACGVLMDGAYLISDRTYGNDTEERRPTGATETSVERDLGYENGRLAMRCSQVTHGLDRVWNVHREYEFRGGYYQAHWVPVLLEGTVAGITSALVATKCLGPEPEMNCKPLYYMIPLGVDVAYSAVRLAMIDKPKLVDKQASTPHTAPNPQPVASVPVPCEPNSGLVLGTYLADPQALRLPFDAMGNLTPPDEQRAIAYLARRHEARVILVPGGMDALEAPTNRCTLLRQAMQAGRWEAASGLGPECPGQPQAR